GDSTDSPASVAVNMAATSGTPRSFSQVERPMSRLSKRITYRFWLARPWQKSSGQAIICAPRPMTSTRGGSFGLPNVSYSSSRPLACALMLLVSYRCGLCVITWRSGCRPGMFPLLRAGHLDSIPWPDRPYARRCPGEYHVTGGQMPGAAEQGDEPGNGINQIP